MQGWWDDTKNAVASAWDTTTSVPSSLWNDLTEGSSIIWDAASNKFTGTMEEAQQVLTDLKKKMNELVATQAEVDGKIAAMPDGSEKEEIKLQRDQNRGMFTDYVLPAWEKIAGIMGWNSDPAMGGTVYASTSMGIIPVVAYGGTLAAVTIAVSILAYVTQSIYKEQQMLSDPRLKLKFLQSEIEGGGIVGAIGKASKALPWVVGGIAAIYLLTFIPRRKT